MFAEDHETYFSGSTVPRDGSPQLSADASLMAALGAFEQYMENEGLAENTRKAFASDVRLLAKYLGIGQPVGQIGTRNLNEFLNWLLSERGIPCSQKSYARRVTTLKKFFGWLQNSGVLLENPADAVIQISVSSPLPVVPTEEELARALTVSESIRAGSPEVKPDARPHMLLSLLLQTGIKKYEAMALVPNHVDRDDPDEPYLFIRIKNPRLRLWKERKIKLERGWLDVLDEYLTQYQPSDALFTCTARNLEYILSEIGQLAGLPQGRLSFENLRWASALRDCRDGVEANEIRQRLGLSPVTWRETKAKLDRLLAQQQSV